MGMSESSGMLRRHVLAPSEIAWNYPPKGFLLKKRALDILISVAVCVLLLWWLLPILAILIKLDSKGPVFFVQQRVGLFGNKFGCIKLRTMIMNEDADHLQASNNDPRITRIGKFLRLSCLDELPQFINVLRGEMSIVGPRPHMITDCREFIKVVPTYNFRHSVKPGITGVAQIKGLRGKTESVQDVILRYQWDCFYVLNATVKMDFELIYKTISQVVGTVIGSNAANGKKKEASIYQLPSVPSIYSNQVLSDVQSTTSTDRLTRHVGTKV